MQLENLYISLQTYGPHEGKYTGTARFKCVGGHVEIVLTPEISEQTLTLCATAIVANAREVSASLTAQTMLQVDKQKQLA